MGRVNKDWTQQTCGRYSGKIQRISFWLSERYEWHFQVLSPFWCPNLQTKLTYTRLVRFFAIAKSERLTTRRPFDDSDWTYSWNSLTKGLLGKKVEWKAKNSANSWPKCTIMRNPFITVYTGILFKIEFQQDVVHVSVYWIATLVSLSTPVEHMQSTFSLFYSKVVKEDDNALFSQNIGMG